jgi:hypothetical protein
MINLSIKTERKRRKPGRLMSQSRIVSTRIKDLEGIINIY